MLAAEQGHESERGMNAAQVPDQGAAARLAVATERIKRLSDGQLEVLRLVDQHLNSKEIAAELGISPHTVDQRIRGAIRILGVARRQEAARLVAQIQPYQRLIHQPPHIDESPRSDDDDPAISIQIRHADRAGGAGLAGFDTEQGTVASRSFLVPPWSTRRNPRNEMSVGQRLLWIAMIAMGASFSAGMYLAGLESLARLAGH
jgi:DNA-binding CsgD family transcriptional regulator